MKFKIIVLLLLQSLLCFAQKSRFSEGETLYVWALNGLNMRKLPDAKSEKIATLPYGEKVTVQANIGVIIAHEVEEFKDFKVKGVWLLVKFGDKEGFVFDGYLSRLVVPEKVSTNGEDNLVNYFDTKVGKVGERYDRRTYGNGEGGIIVPQNQKIESGQEYGFSQKYKLDISLNITSCNEIGPSYKIKIPNGSLFEAYILIKKLEELPKKDQIFRFDPKKKHIETKTIFKYDDGSLEEGGGCDYDFKVTNGVLIIEGGCGC